MVRSELTFDGSRVAHRAIGPGSLVASRFRLEDLLEEHSGARFWRATDLTLARNVAVHVIRRDDPRAAAVLTAARTSATVSDQRILRVLDAVEEDDLVHVVHEWGSGVSLDKLLTEELLEPRRAAWLVREVAEAIAVAHRQGIAHGRLVPENVLLTDVGSVKLIGFVVDAVLHGRTPSDAPVLPPHVGPGGEPPSEHESDVLNLGALLYACLTGKWAGYPASVLPEAPYDHDRVCRPRQVRAGVPRHLDTLCDSILNPPPRGRRFESAAEICSALGEYLGDAVTPVVSVTEATAFLDPRALRAPQTEGTLGSYDGDPPADRSEALLDTQPGLPMADARTPAAAPSPAPARHAPGDDLTRPANLTPVVGDRGAHRGGTAAPPVHWGPDRSADPAPDAGGDRPGSVWWRLAAVVGVIALILLGVVIGTQLGGEDPSRRPDDTASDTPRDNTSPQVVQPVVVDDFDPDGGPVPDENSELVPLATDGKPATAWETKTYFEGPQLAPYRSGVGLLLDLGQETEVSEVGVTLVGGPYDLALLAAPEGAQRPTAADGMTAVEARTGVSGQVVLRGNETARTRYLVVWLTALPRSTDGYSGGIAEVVVRS